MKAKRSEQMVGTLQALADNLKNNIEEMARPLVIEFAGTPKAGKTMCVNSLAKFLRRNSINAYTVTERASVCPLRNKRNPSFNFWTASTSVAQLLEAVDMHKEEKRAPVIILDRGLFDALVWMSYHEDEGSLSEDEMAAIESFFLMDRLTRQIDLVVSLSVDSEKSLLREAESQIVPVEGSIMNSDVLAKYNISLDKIFQRCAKRFNRVVRIDTTETTPEEGVLRIAESVLSALDDLLDERIAVIPRGMVEDLFNGSRFIVGEQELHRSIAEVVANVQWLRRSEAEERYDVVQLVPVATPWNNEEMLVVTSRGFRHGRLTDKHAVWVGGHCRKSDRKKGSDKISLPRRTLMREIEEELDVAVHLRELSAWPTAMVWEVSNRKSSQHLGVFYTWVLPKRVPRERLHEREITERDDKSLFTRFLPVNDELSKLKPWESWSVTFLRSVFGIEGLELNVDDRQLSFFNSLILLDEE